MTSVRIYISFLSDLPVFWGVNSSVVSDILHFLLESRYHHWIPSQFLRLGIKPLMLCGTLTRF